jgi:hypothetical protein
MVALRPGQEHAHRALALLDLPVELDLAVGDGLAGLEAVEAAGGPGAVGMAGLGDLHGAVAHRHIVVRPRERAVPVGAAVEGVAPVLGLVAGGEVVGEHDVEGGGGGGHAGVPSGLRLRSRKRDFIGEPELPRFSLTSQSLKRDDQRTIDAASQQ